MRSWKPKILIVSILALGFLSGACFAIDEIPDDAPRPNATGGYDIPVGEAPKVDKKIEGKRFELISDKIEYFPEERKIVTSGRSSIAIKGQLTKLKADKITMYQDSNEIFAEGNVVVLRNGMEMKGDYIRVDLTKESVLIAEPVTEVENIRLVAKKGYVYADDIEAVDGVANIKQQMTFILASSAFRTGFEHENNQRMLESTETKEYKDKLKGKTYNIKTQEMELITGKERHFVKMKNATIYKGKLKIATVPSVVISSDKNFSEVETMLPVMGKTYQSGAYFGPAGLFNLPGATSLKVAPLVMYDDGFGMGAFGRIRNSTNKTEMMYGNVKDNFILSGEQELWGKKWRLNYSRNAYVDGGFMGERLPGHMAELEYRHYRQFKDLGLIHRAYYKIGVVGESTEDRRFEKRKKLKHENDYSTMRMKVQGMVTKQAPIFDFLGIRGNLIGQYDFTQYGTGENVAVARIGPQFRYSGKDLMVRANYFISGQHGQSPFLWDRYNYGKQTAGLGFEYRFNDKVSFGYTNVMNLLKNNADDKLLAENKFFVKVGPDDFKFCFAYDTVRRRTRIGLNLLVGSEKSDIKFDKFKIRDYKNLEKDKKEEKL